MDISEEYADVACRAARVLGLNVAGVDLLEGNDGPLVLEVNRIYLNISLNKHVRYIQNFHIASFMSF